jgi:hypothetical protein
MAMLEDVGGYLDTQVAALTLGTNLFYSLMPETVDNCVALYENAGVTPNFTMGSVNTPQLERPQLQFILRNTSYANGRTLAETIYRTLTAIANQTINGVLYLRVQAAGVPAVIERDASKRTVFSCNFDVIKALG